MAAQHDRFRDPARSVAQRMLDRASSPDVPVNVERLVTAIASLRESMLPGGLDAAVRLADPPSPRARSSKELTSRHTVFVQPALARVPERRRVVLAHALGHLSIGWHIGMTGCRVFAPHDTATTVGRMEAEADEFAAALLAPASWVRTRLEKSRLARSTARVAGEASITLTAAATAVAAQLPPAFVWAIVDSWDNTLASGTSPGTSLSAPPAGQELERSRLADAATAHEQLEVREVSLHWWQVAGAARRAPTRDIVRTLEQIMDDVGVVGSERDDVRGAIAGCLGDDTLAATLGGADAVLSDLIERFEGRGMFVDVLSHPGFAAYLDQRMADQRSRMLARP